MQFHLNDAIVSSPNMAVSCCIVWVRDYSNQKLLEMCEIEPLDHYTVLRGRCVAYRSY